MDVEKKYFKRLDIVRNLSCILILFYHLNILKGGFLAVCTFFVLSGYLIYISVFKNEKFSLKSYYINRFKKLYIPLIVITFITVILYKIGSNINWMNLKKETFSVVFGYNNFWQLGASFDYFTKNINSPFIHLWYISILIQLELIFPILFKIIKKVEEKIKKDIFIIFIIFLIIITTAIFIFLGSKENIMYAYYNTLARSFSFLFGVLLAIILNKYDFNVLRKFEKHSTSLFIIYSIALIVLCSFIPNEPIYYMIYMILATIISTLLIKNSICENTKTRKMDKHIKAFAKITYEVYLVQYPIIFFMQSLRINEILKAIFIILLTFVTSFLIHLIIYFPIYSKVIRRIRIALLSLIIIIGSIILIIEPDHSDEMEELKNKLNENIELVEEKNNKNNDAIVVEIDSTIDENKISEEVKNLPVVGIGDSVLLAAIDELYATFPNGNFDGKVSRSIRSSRELLTEMKENGELGNILILSLANNGDYSNSLNDELMEILGDRKIYWVNAVGADDPEFNERFKQYAENHSNICIVDWEKAAENHPEYFYADGIHPKGDGIDAYVNTIYEAIYNDMLKNI